MSEPIKNPTVTFIVTTYNQADVISELIASLPHGSRASWEAVLVDDASTDDTPNIAKQHLMAAGVDFTLEVLPSNSGGPAAPRNRGLDRASGEFIFFIDGDDVLDSRHFDSIVNFAREGRFDVVRLPMLVEVDRRGRRVVDRVKLEKPDSTRHVVTECIRQQSMGIMSVIKRSVIEDGHFRFDPTVKMGEDLMFMADVITSANRVGYFDDPLYCYRKTSTAGSSTTASLDSRLVTQAVESWERVQGIYLAGGYDFLALHGAGTVNYVLSQVQKYYLHLDPATFDSLGKFVRHHKTSLKIDAFPEPFRSQLRAAAKGDRRGFDQAVKPRLLIAGHDLKFIEGAIPALEEWFEVKLDRWPSEREHDANTSDELLSWAQLVWVEWMTAASVWYSKRIRPSQKMVVRCHFYEITRDSGFELDKERVSAVVAIALHTYEDIVAKFDFKREGVRLIPNYYDVNAYRTYDSLSRDPFSLALVGSVPRRKGLHRALEILRQLREQDSRYTLTIFGKAAEDFPWVRSVPAEMDYYRGCESFIREHQLEAAVKYAGWAAMQTELGKYGCVLSVSDFEGSHVAPGEAFCAGIPLAILRWRGAELVYPEEFIFDSVDEMAAYISSLAPQADIPEGVAAGRQWFDSYQSLPRFVESVKSLFTGLPTAGELKGAPLL